MRPPGRLGPARNRGFQPSFLPGEGPRILRVQVPVGRHAPGRRESIPMNNTDFGSAKVPKKTLVTLLVLGLLFAAYYFALPVFQGVFLPEAPPGGWLVRPIHAARYGAAVVLMALTLPLIAPGLRRLGFMPQAAKKAFPSALWAYIQVTGLVALVVYFMGGVFYFSSHTLITEQEILIQNLVYPRRYGMNDIAALVEIPEGFRVKASKGPVLTVRFHDGRSESLSLDCEGLTQADVADIRRMLTARTGKAWERDPRVELRKQ